MKYIHYGDNKFDINKFNHIVNRPEFTKPIGGFWGSRVNAEFGWKDWCIENEFKADLDNYFEFELKDNAKILIINNIEQLEKLPQVNNKITFKIWKCLDFEKLSKEYDAIEILISKDHRLYQEVYGWDCDSILVMNPRVII